ncbi:MAG: hypothetical protein P1P88_02845 [Bacteroidales bacterium]|nr:hypothetical protein [Bacteroidales bacterium]
MKKRNPYRKKFKGPNPFWSGSEKKTLIAIGLILAAIIIIFYSQLIGLRIDKENAYKAFIGKEIPDSMVCMVSGEVKNKAIKPIFVNGKTYWGCCNMCIAKLTNNTGNVQFALDPLTKKQINKSDAVIRLNPKYQRQALFFESNKTYHQYIQLINGN